MSNEKLYVADSFHVDKKPFLENEYSAIVIDDFSSNKKYVESEVMHFQLEDKNVNELIDSMYADYAQAEAKLEEARRLNFFKVTVRNTNCKLKMTKWVIRTLKIITKKKLKRV